MHSYIPSPLPLPHTHPRTCSHAHTCVWTERQRWGGGGGESKTDRQKKTGRETETETYPLNINTADPELPQRCDDPVQDASHLQAIDAVLRQTGHQLLLTHLAVLHHVAIQLKLLLNKANGVHYFCFGFSASLSLAGNSGRLTWVRHSSRESRSMCTVFSCSQTVVWYGCQCLGLLTCAQMLVHATAHGGCTDSVTESALEVDSGRKIPCRTGDSSPRQCCAWLFTVLPLSCPAPFRGVTFPAGFIYRSLGGFRLPRICLLTCQGSDPGFCCYVPCRMSVTSIEPINALCSLDFTETT